MRNVEELASIAADCELARVVNNHGPFAPSRLCVNQSTDIVATPATE
jgi:hypothetical protein